MDAAKALAYALTISKTIEVLELCKCSEFKDLESNAIGLEGFMAIIESLKTSTSMRELNLDFNSLGEEGGFYLASTINHISAPLRSLSLGNNEMNDKSALELIKALIS